MDGPFTEAAADIHGTIEPSAYRDFQTRFGTHRGFARSNSSAMNGVCQSRTTVAHSGDLNGGSCWRCPPLHQFSFHLPLSQKGTSLVRIRSYVPRSRKRQWYCDRRSPLSNEDNRHSILALLKPNVSCRQSTCPIRAPGTTNTFSHSFDLTCIHVLVPEVSGQRDKDYPDCGRRFCISTL